MYTGMLAEERDKRGQYVVQLLNEMSSTHPHKNVLIINQSCRHRKDFNGTTTERSASFDAGEALGYGAGRDERLVTHFFFFFLESYCIKAIELMTYLATVTSRLLL